MKGTLTTMQTAMHQRFYPFDYLRIFAALLIVFGHTLFIYCHFHFMGVNTIPSSLSHKVLGVLMIFLDSFLLQIFFLLAGFFMVFSLAKKSGLAVLHNRWQRIGIPLCILLAILVGYHLVLIILAAFAAGHGHLTWQSLTHYYSSHHLSHLLNSTSYFWFLYYLMIIHVVHVMIRPVLQWINQRLYDFSKWRARLTTSPLTPLLFAVVCFIVMRHQPRTIAGFDSSFIPNIHAMMNYGLFYLFGCWMYHDFKAVVTALKKYWLLNAVAGFTVLGFYYYGLIAPYQTHALYHLTPTMEYFGYALISWIFTLMLFGFACRWCQRGNRIVEYLSPATYWIYLSHLPLLLLMHAIVASLFRSAWAQVIVLTFSVPAIDILLYQLIVRKTVIGRLLGVAKPSVQLAQQP